LSAVFEKGLSLIDQLEIPPKGQTLPAFFVFGWVFLEISYHNPELLSPNNKKRA